MDTSEFWAPYTEFFTMPGGASEPAVDKELGQQSVHPSVLSARPYQRHLLRQYLSSRSYVPERFRNGNQTMQTQTFYVANQVPQIQNNFNSGIWSSLESAVQSLAKSEEIYVVTGVAFNREGENRTINYVSPANNSSQKCPIPNYFYKLVLRVKYSGSTISAARAIGFRMEHKTYSGDSYQNYSVTVDEIEKWTGIDFFVNLPDPIESSAESASANWSDVLKW